MANAKTEERGDEIPIENLAVNEEVETFEMTLDENGERAPRDDQGVFIGELFEESPPGAYALVGPAGPAGNEVEFSCEFCVKRFKTRKRLAQHTERQHAHQHKKLKCDQCGIYLKTRSIYNAHCQRHRNGKPFACDTCGKHFAAWQALQIHRKIHDGTGERFRCKICGKDFGRVYSLNDHMKLHSGKEVFSCGKCNLVFPIRRRLLLHERSHLVAEAERIE